MKKYIYTAICLMAITACKNDAEKISAEDIKAESAKANAYFEKTFQEEVDESPMLQTQLGIKKDYGSWDDMSSQAEAEDLEQAKQRLNYLKDSINVKALDEATTLSYKLAMQSLEDEIEDYSYRLYNYPINQMHGAHAEIPAFLINMHRVDNVEDAQAYISRLKGLKQVFLEIAEGLGTRETNGIIPPKFVFDKVIDDTRNLLKGRPFEKSNELSTLMNDFKSKVDALEIDQEEKKK